MKQTTTGTNGGIMAQLKAATDRHHRRAEGRRLQQEMVRGVLPRDKYAAYLGELLHVHRRLEAALAERAAVRPALTAVFRPHHARESDLQVDLEFHGHECGPANEATRSLLSELDRLANEQPIALLGPLYVLEGSMNGNKFIARALMGAWSLGPGPGFRYLDPYGGEQPARWAEFRADMDAQALTSAEEAAIISAAQRTFEGIGAIADLVYAMPGSGLAAVGREAG